MRFTVLVLAMSLLASACSATSARTSSSVAGSQPAPLAGSPSTNTTTTSLPPPTSVPDTSTTTMPSAVVPVADEICESYLDYVAAFDRERELDALRRLDILLGLPRSERTSTALAVLRGRRATSNGGLPEAQAVLQQDYAPACGEPGPGYAGRYDRLLTDGVIVSRSGGVQLLSGSELIPEDPAGPYVDAYGGRAGGMVALEQIGGLEIVEYRAGTGEIPRDLLLDVDLRLHGMAFVGGTDQAVVTTWEADEFGDETQFLDLLPVDGGPSTRVGVVGTLTTAAETVSYGDGYFLVSESFVGGARIYALDLDGSRRDVPGLPLFAEGSGPMPLQRARVSPDGEKFAYLRVLPGVGEGGVDVAATELVVQSLDDGGEELSVEIGGRDQAFSSLDYDGHWAIAARVGTLVVADTWGEDAPELLELSLAGVDSARFLDGALLVGR